ncbi:hypothetical protein KKC13_00560 [bacterium]|nr:hypothetical protein [bacterium]MBU1958869.1 hypothetical protein [bacterium]
MFKYLLPLILTSLLFADSLQSSPKIVPIDEPFMLESATDKFDSTLSYTHTPLLSCQPKLDVVYKVESSKKLKIIPKKPLRSGNNYSCDYNGESFSFTTVPLQVMEANYFKADKLLRLSFNDAINSDNITKHIKLTKIDKLSKTNLNYNILQNSGKNMVLKITEPVLKSTIELNIDKALSTPHNSTLEKAYSDTFNTPSNKVTLDKEKKAMIINDAPQMVALKNGEFALRIFLNDTLEGKAEQSIEIEGIENFKLQRDNYIDYTLREQLHISEETYWYTDVISSEFQPNTTYNVTLKKGLKTYRELKEDKYYSVKTGDRAKSIIFSGDKNYISNSGELGFSSVNVDHATLIVERLLDDNLRYFMNFNQSKTEDIHAYTQEVFTKELTLNNEKNTLLKQKFSLKDLGSELPYGVYNITLRYNEKLKDESKEYASSKVLFLSNLGISLNLAKEQAFVTVLSLDKAQPLSSATVELYGQNNALIGTATTNKDGVAIIEKEHLLESKPKGVIVKTSKDKNFLALNQQFLSPDPKYILREQERFRAHVYFQSKLVRPAGKIHALITIKDRDFISANKLPIKLLFREHYGKTLHEKVYHSDEFGLIDFSYQMEREDRTGTYELLAFIGEKEIGRETIKVEAFMPPKIENSIHTNKEIYQEGELIELHISSSYLFGAPSSGLNGTVTLDAMPLDFEHDAFKNYTFSNAELLEKNVQSYLNGFEPFTLNEEGKYTLVLPTKVQQKVPSILEAMIGVTVMDDTQPVSNYKNIKIYPYTHMVGLKINKNSFEKGQKLEGKAVLIDPITGELIQRQLYAVVKKINWQYDYSDGNYNWQKETTVVDNFSLNSNETFSRDIHDNGDYILEVHDHFGGHSASSAFDVWWWSYSNISPKNDLKSVEINIEDKLYQKGDELEVSIKSPIIEGQLMLTLESEKVELYRRITLEKGVAKIKLPINFDMQHGLHLHATAIRASDTPSQLIPFRAMGYKFIKPNRNEHKIDVKIDAPKVSKSKTSSVLKISTSKPSKVLVSIVDKGILQLSEQKKPEIFDFFNEPTEKQLSYYDLYDQLMSYIAEGKLIDFGADGTLAMRAKHLPPDLGKRVKPFMLWSGIIDLSSKEKSITIDIPEFNGRAALVAIAINENSIGVQEEEMTIKDDVMLKPSYPKYALAGDSIEVPLRIFNTTNVPKTVSLSSKLSKNLAFTLKEESLTIPANSSAVVETMLYANEVGKGLITLYAYFKNKKGENEKVSNTLELPIYNPHAISTKTFKGISNTTQTFTAPKAYNDAKVFITLSNNLVGALRDDLKYLVQYPYGCAEQTSSQLLAMHYAKAFLEKDVLVGESENFIRQGVKKLQNMQNYYGEFYYWAEGNHVNAYASLYAAQTLLELQRDGTDMATSFVKKITTMLNAIASANGSYEGTYSNFHRLYAAFILAEHKTLEESTANMLYEQGIYKKHFLSKLYMAAILKMQGKVDEANRLYNENSNDLAQYTHKAYGNTTGNFESNVRDMFLHFIIKTAYFNKEAKDLVSIQKEFSNLYSTQSKAVALKAISLYLGKPQNSKLDVDVEVNEQKENHTKPQTITLDKLSSQKIRLTPLLAAMSYNIELVKHLPRALKNELSKTKELSIMREFIDTNGEKVQLDNLRQGNTIYSKVTLANYGEINQVVVSQRVPACLSIVNSNIHDQQSKFKNENIQQEYREILDDRVLNFINLKKKEKYDKKLKKHISLQNRGVIYTPLMVTTVGECLLPAVISEAMYDTRINDYAKETESIVVQPIPNTKPKSAIPKITQQMLNSQAASLVRSLYTKEMSSQHPEDFVHFFNYPIPTYYRSKNATKEMVLKDKEAYFKNWSKRLYKNIKIEIVGSNEEEKEVRVKIIFDYLLNNGENELNGKSQHLLTVKEINGKLLITKVELAK